MSSQDFAKIPRTYRTLGDLIREAAEAQQTKDKYMRSGVIGGVIGQLDKDYTIILHPEQVADLQCSQQTEEVAPPKTERMRDWKQK